MTAMATNGGKTNATRRNTPRLMARALASVHPVLRREALHVVGERVEVHGAIVDADAALLVAPDDGVLHPGLVVALGEILAGVGAAALGAVLGRGDRDHRLVDEVV